MFTVPLTVKCTPASNFAHVTRVYRRSPPISVEQRKKITHWGISLYHRALERNKPTSTHHYIQRTAYGRHNVYFQSEHLNGRSLALGR